MTYTTARNAIEKAIKRNMNYSTAKHLVDKGNKWSVRQMLEVYNGIPKTSLHPAIPLDTLPTVAIKILKERGWT